MTYDAEMWLPTEMIGTGWDPAWQIEMRLVEGQPKRTYAVYLDRLRVLGWVRAEKTYPRPSEKRKPLNVDWRWMATEGTGWSERQKGAETRTHAIAALVEYTLVRPREGAR